MKEELKRKRAKDRYAKNRLTSNMGGGAGFMIFIELKPRTLALPSLPYLAAGAGGR